MKNHTTMPIDRTLPHLRMRSPNYSPMQRASPFVILCLLLVLLATSGCSMADLLVPNVASSAGSTPTVQETPSVSAYRPNEVLQVALDTPPLMPAPYFHAAAVAIADRIDALVTANQGGLTVYVSYIESDSLQQEVLTITVPKMPADPPAPEHLSPTPNASAYQSPYDLANASAAVAKANNQEVAAWQLSLKRNHAQLAAVRTFVKKSTDMLRNLRAPFDNTGADVFGALDLASRHLQNVTAEKILLLASPLINNTSLQQIGSLDFTGVTVKVIYHTCAIASVCQRNDAFWQHLLLSAHAKKVQFFDPAMSETLVDLF